MVKLLNNFDLPGAANDDLAQRKSGLFVPRTLAQVKADLGLDRVANIKDTTGSLSPAVTDDASAGYSVGSVWGSDMAHTAWVCVDNTNGAALWRQINLPAASADGSFLGRAGGAYAMRSAANTKVDLSLDKVLNVKHNITATTVPGTGNDGTQGYSVGSFWFNTSTHVGYFCVDATTSTALWVKINFISSVSSPLVESGGGLSLPDATASATGALTAAGFDKLTNWPKLRLDFSLPGSIYAGTAQTAGTTYNLHTPQNFTVNSTLSVIIMDLRLNVLLNATAAGVPQYAVQYNLDSGSIKPIGGDGGNNSGTTWFTAGGGIVILGPGLSAGTHSIAIQGVPSVNVNTYLRNGGTTEFLQLRLIEINS